jgi:dipeptidyl-peptidase-4
VGVVAAGGGETRWIDLGGDPSNEYVARMDWADSSSELVLQRLDRHQNTLDLLLVDTETASVRTLVQEEDEAWVDAVDDLTWLDGGASFLWVSERDGWRHLYRVSRDGARTTCLTPGDYDVISVAGVDRDGDWVHFIASPREPTRRFLYRTRLDGTGELERLTPVGESGTHAYQHSANARWAIHTRSSFDQPPYVDLLRLPEHEVLRRLVDDAELVERLRVMPPSRFEFFRIRVGEGAQSAELDAWCMFPPDFDRDEKWPVLFYVYGEPWGQTVADRWDGERHLWHRMLTQRGYVVMSVDNRGTPSPRGREWRKCVYGRIGGMTSREQAEAVLAIQAARPWVDPERIGIWGWSGGGSSTLNAMFRYPDVYQMGMSVAPVPDQRLYDTIYQERYTGLLDEHPERYLRNSPITHAEGLRGDLLIVHGTGDDNVHYQGTERLIDVLVAANKPFTMMAYPMRSHSIHEGQGTKRHLYELLTRYLEEHLEAGPR